jgi:hypothetical protein
MAMIHPVTADASWPFLCAVAGGFETVFRLA